MKKLHRVCAALLLISTLSFPVFAGQIEIGSPQPPPPPPSAPAQGEMSTTLNGDIHTGAPGDIHTTESSADVTLAGAVVDLVQGVLSLL
jgi:hypothetical protein